MYNILYVNIYKTMFCLCGIGIKQQMAQTHISTIPAVKIKHRKNSIRKNQFSITEERIAMHHKS